MQQKDETFQLYRIFCRIWAAGGTAKFSTESKEGRCSAKLEIENCLKSADEPGATRLQSAKHAKQQTHRPCHRGPASKARSRARAVAFRAGKAAAATEAAAAATEAAAAKKSTQECIKGDCWHYICKYMARKEETSEVQSTTEDTNVWKQVSGRRKGGMAKQKR